MSDWSFFWCSLASQDFTVAGISFHAEVFKRFEDTKENADVIVPIYNDDYKCRIYRCRLKKHDLAIAYGEYSPGAYVAFADQITLPLCRPRYTWGSEGKWVKVV